MTIAPAPTGKRSPFGPLALAAALFTGVLLLWLAIRADMFASLDAGLLRGLRVTGHPDQPIGPHWLERLMRDVTVLGGGRMLTLLVMAAAGYLLVRRQARGALLLIIAIWSGSMVASGIKTLVGRARPEIVPQLVAETSHSFPSEHAANSALVFLTIALLAVRHEPDRAMRRYIGGVAILMAMIVGVSRAYLGVHWPSDILAGWCFGAGWAMLTTIVANE